mgnify:FL=1
MLTLVDVKAAINALLKDKYGYKVYGREVKEGFETPSFFVELLVDGMNAENVNFTSNTLTVIITYFQSEPSDLDNIKKYDGIKALFMPKLVVKDRHLTTGNFRYEYADTDFMQIYFDLNYYDGTTKDEGDLPLTGKIYLNFKGGEQ